MFGLECREPHNPASGKSFQNLILRYPLVVSEGYNIGFQLVEDMEEVRIKIAEHHEIRDIRTFDIVSPQFFIMRRQKTLYPLDGLIPRNDYSQFITDSFRLFEKFDMPRMQVVKSARTDYLRTHDLNDIRVV